MRFQDVFPIIVGTKKPAIKWATERFAGTIPEGQPYGVPTGPRNDVWVLDLDEKNGVSGVGSLDEYAKSAGVTLPHTYTVRTPSGGYHLYFAWDPQRPVGNRMGVLPGVDVRGAGGYVCAGGDYRALHDVAPAPAHDWLYTLVGPAPEKVPQVTATAIAPDDPRYPERVRLAWEYLHAAPACVSGQGGQKRLWEIALRVTRTYELSPEDAWRLFTLRTVTGPSYNDRCVPPWDEWEAKRAFARAATEGHGPTGIFSGATLSGWGATPGGPAATVNPDDPWRRRAQPDHAYTFDVAMDLNGGSGAQAPATQRQIAGALCGPGAHPQWRGVWQYDEFRNRILAVNPPMRLDAETKGLTPTDVSRVALWYSYNGLKVSAEGVDAAIHVAAEACRVHPVADYLDSLPATEPDTARTYFDGIAGRLWGALPARDRAESEYLRKMAIAAVRRIRRPGTKVDTMLILQGPQGYRKSQFCEKLFSREFFRNQLPDLTSRDAVIALEGVWGIEIAEMASFRRGEENTKKEFLTRCVDKYRPVWAAGILEVPRQCVFLGTTNEEDTLRDPTGARRYWICEIQTPIALDAFDRDAFWSAACALESAGEEHWIDYQAAVAEKSAEDPSREDPMAESRHEEEDPWEDYVMKYVAAEKAAGKDSVRALEVLTRGIALSADKQTTRELRRVQAILRRRFGRSRVEWSDGAAHRVYCIVPMRPPPTG